MKKVLQAAAALILISNSLAAQNVGIGTSNPNSSAILDVSANNKGVLFPRISLFSAVDNTAVSSPAPNLIVFNTNASMPGGVGLFYNAGSAASPNWAKMGDLKFPYYGATSATLPTFRVDNYGASVLQSVAIKGFSQNGDGIQGISGGSGRGVYAYSTSGNALEVDGKINIAGPGQSPAQGKVLTSDANGNATWEGAVAFSAYGIGGDGFLSVPPNGYTKVPFAYQEYDLANNYSLPNQATPNTFTVPVSGIYNLNTQIFLSSLYDYAIVSIILVRNGVSSTIAGHQFYGTNVEIGLVTLNKDVMLLANDQVFVQIHHTSDSPRYLHYAYGNTWFSGRLMVKF